MACRQTLGYLHQVVHPGDTGNPSLHDLCPASLVSIDRLDDRQRSYISAKETPLHLQVLQQTAQLCQNLVRRITTNLQDDNYESWHKAHLLGLF